MANDFNVFAGTPSYITSPELRHAVAIAAAIQRPLLVRGEPGTGKTLLAHAIAKDLGLERFYWLREVKGLRKRPSTSELIDWIGALLAAGIPRGQLTSRLPFLGALIKKEEDLAAVARARPEDANRGPAGSRSRPCAPSNAPAPRSCSTSRPPSTAPRATAASSSWCSSGRRRTPSSS